MPTKQALLVAGAAALVMTGTGAIAAATAGSVDPPTRYEVEIPEFASPEQHEAIDAMLYDKPIPVQDSEGAIRGFVRDSALTERDDRVDAQIMAGFREPEAGEDDEYDRLYEALRILDPVPVTDDEGATVGYWTRNFKSIEEIGVLTPGAQATVTQLLR